MFADNVLGNRIKSLRKEKNITQEELAQLLGLKGKSSVANYENGLNAPSDEIKSKMCEIFNCSMDYLMGRSEYKTNEDEILNFYTTNFSISKDLMYTALGNNLSDDLTLEELHFFNQMLKERNKCRKEHKTFDVNLYFKKHENEIDFNHFSTNKILDEYSNLIMAEKKVWEIVSKEIKNKTNKIKVNEIPSSALEFVGSKKESQFYMCPVYGRIAAGQPNWAEECIEGRIPIDPVLMDIINPEECYFLKVNGESMNKIIRNGAYALIRKTDWVKNGEIAVVLVNGYDATLKKFTKQGDLVILEPMSDDPSFETQVYDKNTEIRVIGKYIGKFETN